MRPGGSKAAPGASLVLEVSPDLPPWSPRTPAQGWTPAAVWHEAAAWADVHAEATTWRRITQDAARELFKALPTVKRAEIVERLAGVDHRADVLGLTTAPDDLDDVAPPF